MAAGMKSDRLAIGIAGAGLLGRLLAWRLARLGHAVTVFDAATDAAPRFGARQAAAFSAAGMLSPLAEFETAGSAVSALGTRSLAMWASIASQLRSEPFLAQRGSLLLAHGGDLGTALRMLSRLKSAPQPLRPPQLLERDALTRIEPAVHGVAHAWLLPDEGQLDPLQMLAALHADACEAGVRWHWSRPVAEVLPQAVIHADGRREDFELVFDVRGVGAKTPSGDSLSVRGVRGETVWLHAPGHGLTRPVRLLHPRHRVYLVPRPGDIVIVGATEIESEDRSPVSLRSAVELMAAAHSVMPALAEARIVRMDTNLRPALPDNEPRIEAEPGRVRINGLFRHGWLVAPAMVQDALVACGLAARTQPELSEAVA
jgi:glycine oxidase